MMTIMKELEMKRQMALDIKAQEREIALSKAARLEDLNNRAKVIEKAIKYRRREEIEREIESKKQHEGVRKREERERDAAIMREQDRLMQQRDAERTDVRSVEHRIDTGISLMRTNQRMKRCTLTRQSRSKQK